MKALTRELEFDEAGVLCSRLPWWVAKVGEANVKYFLSALVALTCSGPTLAQGSDPAKMILFHNQGVAVTDFLSIARCEAARRAILQAVAKDNARLPPPEVLPDGGTIFTLETTPPKMICVPA
ncbi:hypothetical protein [Novosphingobium sp. MBES04]|uniref:hypothetical protein n=1 Tax=Novosphingobium sp. MBES04 TaxID=1206458 RepID=UPI0011866101|nr:hypothetical protein [Novosphingobium sp. MBES04]